ncbi:MAG: T9SS type A sorting domain-containing protein, partial [Calditrichae bacterium]|nr:T9SS type A sorting domain-containing protein [Calditrichia bacterium]
GLSGGGFVVCWESWDQDGDELGIFGQMYDQSGKKYGQEFQVNTFVTDSQAQPRVCSLSDGRFVVIWESYGQDGVWWGIYGQLYENNGTKRGQEFRVNTYTGDGQYWPTVCGLSNSGFVVCWASYGQDGDELGIFGQLYDINGTKYGEEFQINTYTSNGQFRPAVSGLSEGGFVVCWDSWNQDGDDSGIFGQVYDSTGLKRDQEFQVNTYTSDNQYWPSVCGLSDGGFVVCWQSFGYCEDTWGIAGQKYDSSGTKCGYEFHVNTCTGNNQGKPMITSISDSGFVVCWENLSPDRYGFDIYGKYYLADPILHSLQSFSLISPVYDATLFSITANFEWQKASPIHLNFPWELEYALYLDQTEDFGNPQIFSDIYDTTFSVIELIPGQTYFWKVLAKNIEGDSMWSSETFGFYVSHDATQLTHDPNIHAREFNLFSNYPNPFNPETTIRYSLPVDQSSHRVIVKIYDVLGQLVITLKDEQQRPGVYHLIWNGRNSTGQAVPSGVYFCVRGAGNFKATQKMLLVR